MNCLMSAWDKHEQELRAWLLSRLGHAADAEDMLQDLFMKALRQDDRFCDISNARAWLFRVARNALADRLRLARQYVELPATLASADNHPAAVDSMAICLPRAVSELSSEDRDVITCCDLDGMTQKDYATTRHISLSATKSRIWRARKRLRSHLSDVCQVRFDDSGSVCCFVPRTPGSG